MKIEFKDKFYEHILDRGYDYFIYGKFSDVKIDNDNISAIVHGTSNYNVNIKIENNIFLEGTCDCPYYDKGQYCKHIACILYYLNEQENKKEKDYLENIVNKVDDKKLKQFIYRSLLRDEDLLNDFRVEFSDYFPKLSKEKYKKDIYNSIMKSENYKGFIDYNNIYKYEHYMLVYINEANNLIKKKDYETAFIIATNILDTIPNTYIDDSNGSTGMISDDCIEIINNIIKLIDKDDKLLKEILDYILNELNTLYLYNYGVELKDSLSFYINNNLFLKEIENGLINALNNNKEKDYFSGRKYYINYLIDIFVLTNRIDNILDLLEEHSYDENICLLYIEELLDNKKIDKSIDILKNKIKNEKDNYKKIKYADKLKEIYYDNSFIEEYKDILYDLFYDYSRYDFKYYLQIKKLYFDDNWNNEKYIIIEKVKNEKYNEILNKIYIEENMIDELYLNICNNNMNTIKKYEEYLLPKYKKEILEIYKKSCLNAAYNSNNRKAYKDVAVSINHIIRMEDTEDLVKILLNEIKEEQFRNRPAMKDEFQNIIIDFYKYIS